MSSGDPFPTLVFALEHSFAMRKNAVDVGGHGRTEREVFVAGRAPFVEQVAEQAAVHSGDPPSLHAEPEKQRVEGEAASAAQVEPIGDFGEDLGLRGPGGPLQLEFSEKPVFCPDAVARGLAAPVETVGVRLAQQELKVELRAFAEACEVGFARSIKRSNGHRRWCEVHEDTATGNVRSGPGAPRRMKRRGARRGNGRQR